MMNCLKSSLVLGVAFLFASASVADGQPGMQQPNRETHLNVRPSAIIQLVADVAPGAGAATIIVNRDGTPGGAFTLPNGIVFVLTDAYSITDNTDPGRYIGRIVNAPGTIDRVRFDFDTTTEGTIHRIAFTSGVVFENPPIVQNFATSEELVVVSLYGYLATD